MRLIRKWWLLSWVKKDCAAHSESQSTEFVLHNRITISQSAFVLWLAKKSIHRFSWILRERKKDNAKKLNRRINEYNSIIAGCAKENYLGVKEGNAGQAWIFTLPLGDDFIASFWYKTILENTYVKAIILAVITLITTYYVGRFLGIHP